MNRFEPGQIHPTAVVAAGAELGNNVTIAAYAVIHDGVRLGDCAVVGPHCVLGEPTANFYRTDSYEPQACAIGANSVIRSHSVIYSGVTIGADFECGHRVTIREGTLLGAGVRVGTASDLQGDLVIGDFVRVHSSVFIAQDTRIEDFCWLFPGVVITDDPHPPSDTCSKGATIRKFAAIAARAVLMPGVEVGEQALVGAMSLVTKDVAPGMVVIGSPAREVGRVADVVCKHGNLDHVYPWPDQFRRGYPDGVLPEPGELG